MLAIAEIPKWKNQFYCKKQKILTKLKIYIYIQLNRVFYKFLEKYRMLKPLMLLLEGKSTDQSLKKSDYIIFNF